MTGFIATPLIGCLGLSAYHCSGFFFFTDCYCTHCWSQRTMLVAKTISDFSIVVGGGDGV